MHSDWWLDISNHLGGVYPFYNGEIPDYFSLSIADILSVRRSQKLQVELDPTALVGKVCMPYLLGNRTLIKRVRRTPWMSSYRGNGQWESFVLPKHGNCRPDPEIFSFQLKQALLNEAVNYMKNKKTVGILLSGGMDSRVAAGILRELQLRKNGPEAIVALTWGAEDSRDVIYAQRIAKQFDWDMVHFPITAETLANNITNAGLTGAEVSPLHLHSMSDIAKLEGIDAILAGSYGDSVGRAEFSGRHVTQLKSVLPKVLDSFGLLKSEAVSQAKIQLNRDLIDSPHLNASIEPLRRREIEQEMHYMRRMLQSCMQTISENIPLYQLFTDPSVFGLMWNLDPTVRNNEWYARILSKLPGDLLDIPWARTGQRFDQPSKVFDNYPKNYHKYGRWLRNDLREGILERLNSDQIHALGIFNEKSLKQLTMSWQKANTDDTNKLDEVVSWLASLHDFIKTYDIPPPTKSYESSFSDSIRSTIGHFHAEAFVAARDRLRK
jgi:asparagine synthase (glutamine-hydrolysing)